MKKCIKCGIEKSFDLFWKNKKDKLGFYHSCKECANIDREKRRDREKEKIYSKRTYEKHRESRIKRQMEYEKNLSFEKDLERREKKRLAFKNSEVQKEKKYHYLKNVYDPIKYKCKMQVYYAIKKGELIKPENCSICNEKSKLDGHHVDYSKPLNVLWVCRKCHKAIHKRLKESNYGSKRDQ